MTFPPIAEVADKLRDAVAPSFTVAVLLLAPFLALRGGRLAPLGAALAMAGGLAAGNYFCGAVPWRPEGSAREWVLAAAGIALIVGLIARIPQVPAIIGWLLRAAGAAAAAWLLVSPGARATYPWIIYAFGAAVLALWAVLEQLAADSPGPAAPLAGAMASATAAAVLMQATFASMADVATFAFGTLLGVALAAWLRPADVGGAMPAVAVLLPAVLLAGRFDTDSKVPDICFLCAGLAPMALVLLLIPPFKRWPPFRRAILGSILLLAPLGVAIVRAMQAPVAEW
jgi:hypothetical protein